MGERVRIHPSTDMVTTSLPQPDTPFEATVGLVHEERNEQDSYFHEDENRRIHTRSITKEITFEMEQEGDSVEYKFKFTKHRDGHIEGGRLILRNNPVADIKDIDVIGTEEV